MDRRAREVARKSILVEGKRAVVLGGDLDVLRKGTAGHEACSFLNADCVPWSVEVSCQGTRIVAMCNDQGSRRGPATCQSVAGSADQIQEQDQESDGTTVPRTLGLIPDLRKGERRELHVCLPRKSDGCARS